MGVFALLVSSCLSMGDDQKKAMPVVVRQPKSTNKKSIFSYQDLVTLIFFSKIKEKFFRIISLNVILPM